MKAKAHLFILCLLALCFALSVMAQEVPLEKLFPPQDTLYNMTPTEDGQTGYHLWVLKPGMESKMPIRKYEEHPDKEMNRNPLKQAPERPPMDLSEPQIPAPDQGLYLLPEPKSEE